MQGKEIQNGNCSSTDFAKLTRRQKDVVKQLWQQGEAIAAMSLDANSIQSLVASAVNDKLETAVICNVANATGKDEDHTEPSAASILTGDNAVATLLPSSQWAQSVKPSWEMWMIPSQIKSCKSRSNQINDMME